MMASIFSPDDGYMNIIKDYQLSKQPESLVKPKPNVAYNMWQLTKKTDNKCETVNILVRLVYYWKVLMKEKLLS